jgi:hypothetical protein
MVASLDDCTSTKAVDETQTGYTDPAAMALRLTPEEAETLALKALGFLAAEPERIAPFLAATGSDRRIYVPPRANPASSPPCSTILRAAIRFCSNLPKT